MQTQPKSDNLLLVLPRGTSLGGGRDHVLETIIDGEGGQVSVR